LQYAQLVEGVTMMTNAIGAALTASPVSSELAVRLSEMGINGPDNWHVIPSNGTRAVYLLRQPAASWRRQPDV
jgi:hypothetical protein